MSGPRNGSWFGWSSADKVNGETAADAAKPADKAAPSVRHNVSGEKLGEQRTESASPRPGTSIPKEDVAGSVPSTPLSQSSSYFSLSGMYDAATGAAGAVVGVAANAAASAVDVTTNVAGYLAETAASTTDYVAQTTGLMKTRKQMVIDELLILAVQVSTVYAQAKAFYSDNSELAEPGLVDRIDAELNAVTNQIITVKEQIEKNELFPFHSSMDDFPVLAALMTADNYDDESRKLADELSVALLALPFSDVFIVARKEQAKKAISEKINQESKNAEGKRSQAEFDRVLEQQREANRAIEAEKARAEAQAAAEAAARVEREKLLASKRSFIHENAGRLPGGFEGRRASSLHLELAAQFEAEILSLSAEDFTHLAKNIIQNYVKLSVIRKACQDYERYLVESKGEGDIVFAVDPTTRRTTIPGAYEESVSIDTKFKANKTLLDCIDDSQLAVDKKLEELDARLQPNHRVHQILTANRDGIGTILVKGILAVMTMGTSLVINKLMGGKFRFWQSHGEAKVNAMTKILDTTEAAAKRQRNS